MNMKAWNSKEHTADQILELTEGRYFASIFEQSVQPEHAVEAAESLKGLDDEVKVYSQAQAIVKAQKLGVAFQDWLELRTFIDTMTTGDYKSNETHQLFSRETASGLEIVWIQRSGEDFVFDDKIVSLETLKADGFEARRASSWIGFLPQSVRDERLQQAKAISAQLPVLPLSEIKRLIAEKQG